jgi:hypothetical protein
MTRGVFLRSSVLLAVSAIANASTNADKSGGWNGSNDPSKWGGYEYVLDRLPLQGQVTDHQPWSDTYWPSNKAGIAARWNWAGQNGFKYKTFTEAEVRAMSPDELAKLSPAEKYDIFMGRFDYPTVASVRKATNPNAEYWAGICHGWSPAAINHAEPAPVTVTSAGGIAVPFGSADVKALIDWYYAGNEKAVHFLGAKCRAGDTDGNPIRVILDPLFRNSACDGVNPGAFQLVLGNELGVRHSGFVADVNRWREVWNQPVYAFRTAITGSRAVARDAAPGTVRELLVHTEMDYADEIDPSWNPVVGTPDFKMDTGKYDYTIELDASGRIVGGEWLGSERPAFLWAAPKLEFTGYFSGISSIYKPAGL